MKSTRYEKLIAKYLASEIYCLGVLFVYKKLKKTKEGFDDFFVLRSINFHVLKEKEEIDKLCISFLAT